MALVDTIARVQAKGNDIQRRLLMAPGNRCFLLKRGVETKDFAVVKELTTGWKLRFSEFRGQPVLDYADTGTGFADEIAQASFIACGVPDGDDKIDVFSIDPERRDVVPPTVTNIFWKVYMVRMPEERFEIPAEEVTQIEVSGSGNPLSHGIYDEMGTYNGKPYYNLDGEVGQADTGDPVTGIYWNGTTWGFSYWNGVSAEVLFFSTDDVDTPDLVTTWQILLGTAPVPTIEFVV